MTNNSDGSKSNTGGSNTTNSSQSQQAQQPVLPNQLPLLVAANQLGQPLFPTNPAMFANAGSFMMPGAAGLMVPNMGMGTSMMDTTIPGMSMMGGALQLPLSASSSSGNGTRHRKGELSAEERAQQNRDRNREHARSTRLRKKAYVQKLKELVEGLHAERTEELRQRKVAIQHLAEMQNVRRAVVKKFLAFLVGYEIDERKWSTLLEDDFWLKQPVTPYRSFRRADIEKECRCTRGLEAMICEAASFSVMIEGIGSRCARWMQIKRDEFLQLEKANRGGRGMPGCVVRQPSKLNNTVSSLSSSSGSSNNNSSGDEKDGRRPATEGATPAEPNHQAKKVSSSSGSSSSDNQQKEHNSSNDYHDYHAKPLPDPKLRDSEDSGPADDSNDSSNGKRVNTDSSSGDDSAAARARPTKKRKSANRGVPGGSLLPPNIAKSGGIPHNIRPPENTGNVSERLQKAPAMDLPPFAGLGGKRTAGAAAAAHSGSETSNEVAISMDQGGLERIEGGQRTGPAVIAADADSSSSDSASKGPQIHGFFYNNEDDMILMENILMCPFIFRSQDAVSCGAMADCVMPGMLRAHFSPRNKLSSVELVYDAMGFMQQLERASGNDDSAQIVPGSLEMALAPTQTEGRVITMAESPYRIVNVNEVWTKVTGYTQMEVEGKEYLPLIEGEGTVQAAKVRSGKPCHSLQEVARGRPACSTNIHYDKDGKDFIEFVCSYPLTNANDEITHILHVSKELPTVPEQ